MDYDYAVEYSQTWSGGLQDQLRPGDDGRVGYMGTWTLGADNAHGAQRAGPGPGPIQARRPIPQLGRISAIRFDGKSIYHGLTLKLERRLRATTSPTTSATRCRRSKDDASSPGATESEANVPQDVRNIFDESGEWAHSSFDHGTSSSPAARVRCPSLRGAGGLVRGVLGDWRVNAIIVSRAARRSPSTSASIAPTSAPVRRSGRTS